MKNTLFSCSLILFLISVLYLPNVFAQNYTQWHLPEGAKARLGKGEITGNVAYSPDGTRLAVASSIGVWIYDAQTFKTLNLLTGHGAPIASVAFSHDGQIIAGGGWNEIIRFWDAETGSLLHTLSAQEDIVSIAFSPDGKTLAGSNVDGIIHLWDTNTGEHLWAPTKTDRTFSGDLPVMENVAFSPDGKTLASSSLTDNTVRLWDAETGNLLHTLIGHTDNVNSVAFSPDGNTIASAGGWADETVRFWDTDTGSPLRTLAVHQDVDNVAFSPDGKTLASVSGGKFFLLDVGTGNLLHAPIEPNHQWFIKDVAFNPDGKTLVSVSGDSWQRISLWQTDTWQRPEIYTDHTGAIESVAFIPDGKTLIYGGRDGHLYRWYPDDTNRGLRAHIDLSGTIRSVAVSSDSKMLATASGRYGRRIILWDISTSPDPKVLTGHSDWVNSLAFSPNGKTLAGGGGLTVPIIYLWDTMTGRLLHTLTGHTRKVESVAFSPNGKTLASTSAEGTVRLWNATTGRHIRTLTGHMAGIKSVAFSPDGKMLASGGGREIHLWDANTGASLRTLTGHEGLISSVSFSPDGQTLASGGHFDLTISLWDTNTGRLLQTRMGHTERIRSVVFSPDGNTLASGSSDGTVLLWEIALAPSQKKTEADVNKDGTVNIIDLTLVVSNFGQTGQNAADINGDGVVNIIDLTLVAGAFGNAAGAPALWSRDREVAPTREQVQQWLREAQQMNLTDPAFQRGILILEHLLVSLTPKETALLPNYPNPFNPETWIPYQLSEPADVSISIYAADGRLVRTLDLGHQPVGIYESRSRAAYWNGRNALGEPVASGVYFYSLTAGEFTATGKMLIRK